MKHISLRYFSISIGKIETPFGGYEFNIHIFGKERRKIMKKARALTRRLKNEKAKISVLDEEAGKDANR